jgi:hypothetical protein
MVLLIASLLNLDCPRQALRQRRQAQSRSERTKALFLSGEGFTGGGAYCFVPVIGISPKLLWVVPVIALPSTVTS